MWGKQRGISMIEVLVTLVILSVGLLGVANLQFVASFNNADALARQQAVTVVGQLSERMRVAAVASTSNDGVIVPAGYLNDANYNFTGLSCTANQSLFACHCLTIPGTLTNCYSQACDAEQLAAFDAYTASCALVQHNPSATLDVRCHDTITTDLDACSPGSRHVIRARWPQTVSFGQQHASVSQCQTSDEPAHACVIQEVFF